MNNNRDEEQSQKKLIQEKVIKDGFIYNADSDLSLEEQLALFIKQKYGNSKEELLEFLQENGKLQNITFTFGITYDSLGRLLGQTVTSWTNKAKNKIVFTKESHKTYSGTLLIGQVRNIYIDGVRFTETEIEGIWNALNSPAGIKAFEYYCTTYLTEEQMEVIDSLLVQLMDELFQQPWDGSSTSSENIAYAHMSEFYGADIQDSDDAEAKREQLSVNLIIQSILSDMTWTEKKILMKENWDWFGEKLSQGVHTEESVLEKDIAYDSLGRRTSITTISNTTKAEGKTTINVMTGITYDMQGRQDSFISHIEEKGLGVNENVLQGLEITIKLDGEDTEEPIEATVTAEDLAKLGLDTDDILALLRGEDISIDIGTLVMEQGTPGQEFVDAVLLWNSGKFSYDEETGNDV